MGLFSRIPLTDGNFFNFNIDTTVNTYGALANAALTHIGAKSDPALLGPTLPNTSGVLGPGFVRGTGANDVITITKLTATTARVTVQPFRNGAFFGILDLPGTPATTISYTVDMAGGLLVDTSIGNDRVILDASLGKNVTIRGARGTEEIVINGKAASGVAQSAVYTPAGTVAYGPDGLSSVGGYPGNWTSYVPGKKVDDTEVTSADNKGAEMQRSIDGGKLTEDWVNGAKWLKARADCTGKIGAVGFCYGGGVCNTLAVRLGADLAGAAPYYGAQPSAEDAAKIKGELCLHYAENDARITGNWPNYKTALDANKVKYEVYTYAGAQHGFHNDSTARYDKAAADLSWQRTLAFFNRTLKT